MKTFILIGLALVGCLCQVYQASPNHRDVTNEINRVRSQIAEENGIANMNQMVYDTALDSFVMSALEEYGPQKKLFSSEIAVLVLEMPDEAGRHPTNIKALGRRPPSAGVEKWRTRLPVNLKARVQLPSLALPLFFIAAGNAPAEFSVVIGASKNDINSVGSEYFSVKFFGRTYINFWNMYIYNSHRIIKFENYVVVPKYGCPEEKVWKLGDLEVIPLHAKSELARASADPGRTRFAFFNHSCSGMLFVFDTNPSFSPISGTPGSRCPGNRQVNRLCGSKRGYARKKVDAQDVKKFVKWLVTGTWGKR
ncbi:hypothetical protein CAEBREN_15775 [Caenorhabditis brenneri]|uniref:Uncharacterized protein n=1 Tax=Caenorhabditis brenneri TaxID=135651 RepID=G0MMU6_CAEBE|nr:hypothetical protein CAEBREN_15775 [Caenorhabditis brenneri]